MITERGLKVAGRVCLVAGIALLVIAILVLLSGCGVPKVSGDVIDKDHREPYHTTYMQPQYMQSCTMVPSYDGKSFRQSCTQVLTGYIPIDQYHPERWRIQVENDENLKDYWIPVTETAWNGIKVGDYFTNEEDE